MSTFGDWLQAQLDERDWSQADLERASGVSSAQISRILSGARGAEADSLRAFAKALHIPQAEVFYAAGQMTEKPGEIVIPDPILADIWSRLELMSEDEKRAARVLLERMFPRAAFSVTYSLGGTYVFAWRNLRIRLEELTYSLGGSLYGKGLNQGDSRPLFSLEFLEFLGGRSFACAAPPLRIQ